MDDRHKFYISGTGSVQRNRQVDIYYENPKRCGFCNKAIPYDKRKNKFCNQSCGAKYNNRGTKRHGTSPCNCLYCNVKLKTSSRKFCSRHCECQYNYEQYIKKWLAGEISGWVNHKTYGGYKEAIGISRYIIRWIKETRGEKCEECGWDKVNKFHGNVPIELEHIDGNRKNNKPNNLKLLCPNCHSLTSTYRALNIKRAHIASGS